MYWKNGYGLLVIALLATESGCAHTKTVRGDTCLRGRIIGPTGPLDDVRVNTKPPTDAKLTVNGVFKLCEVVTTGEKLRPGRYELVAFKPGWRTTQVAIEYEGGDQEIEDIQLRLNDPNDGPKINDVQLPSKGEVLSPNGRPVNE